MRCGVRSGERRRSGDYQIPGPAISEALARRLGVPRTGPDEVRDSLREAMLRWMTPFTAPTK